MVQRAVNDSIDYQRQAWQTSSDDALAAVKAAGVKVITPDKQPFRDAVAPFHQSLQQTDIGPLLQQIAAVGQAIEAEKSAQPKRTDDTEVATHE